MDVLKHTDAATETPLDQTRIDFRPTLVRRSQNCSLLTWSELSAKQIAQVAVWADIGHNAPPTTTGWLDPSLANLASVDLRALTKPVPAQCRI